MRSSSQAPRLLVVIALAAVISAGCGSTDVPYALADARSSTPSTAPTPTVVTDCPNRNPAIELYADVRRSSFSNNPDPSALGDLGECVIRTLWFNEATRWTQADTPIANRILEAGMNPGLNVRTLHAQGVTGKGVTVAIIDQNMQLDHPEFAGKIIKYYDTGCQQPPDSGSMHGPAVTSLLIGNRIGVAPDARIYYAAAPSWKQDAQFYADALDWLVDENQGLPSNARIRAVSVSAAPSGPGSPFTANNDAWDRAVARAESTDLMVLDCTQHHGFVGAGYYDPLRPDDLAFFRVGFPTRPWNGPSLLLFAPTSFRTQAEEYQRGQFSYQYTGQGGLSWAIPYVTGVLALGWQLRPELGATQMKELLLETSYKTAQEHRVIDPAAFIKRVRG